jgi:predicted MFS family arabinose efflux permease
MPALMGLIPQTVGSDRLQEANALLGFTRSVASVGGPALAGILIAIGGPGEAIAVDAATFALSAACLIALRPNRAPATDDEEDVRFRARLRAGWREVRARPWLTYGLAAMAAYHVFVLPAVWILGPALAEQELSGASSWAVIVVCFGLGTVAGNLVALRFAFGRPVLVAALALLGAATQAVIIGSGLGTAGIAVLELLAGVAVSLFFTMWDTSIQQQVAPHAVSRVSSYDFAVSLGLMPLGMAVAGPIAEVAGLHATLAAMSAIGMLAALAWLAVPDVRRVRAEAPVPAPPVPPVPAETVVRAAAEREPGVVGVDVRFERGAMPVEER